MFDLFQLDGPAKARRIVVAMSGGVDSSVAAALLVPAVLLLLTFRFAHLADEDEDLLK
jgi:tRNA U34 2-thiouridine synthase MnmA/TrmU